ncbi:hypothetical protein [Zobellia nedashkovskayae]|nr:hypothetical protein [Zobellia nedashkovskayae]
MKLQNLKVKELSKQEEKELDGGWIMIPIALWLALSRYDHDNGH